MTPVHPLSSGLFRPTSLRQRNTAGAVFLALVFLASALWSGAHARAQDRVADYSDPAQTAAAQAANTPVARPASQGANEVKITLEQLGVGNMPKLGMWNGVRVSVLDGSSEARDVIVRLSSIDSDGDMPQPQVEISTNPGTPIGVWLYARFAFNEFTRTGMNVSVYEAIPLDVDPATTPRESRYRAGRLLGRLDINPPGGQLINPMAGMYGMIGERPLGLRAYTQRPATGQDWAEFHHEMTHIALGLKPGELPDRWMGLDPFSVLVWGSGELTELRADRAEAIREWVNRGGHLVIVLPAVSQLWTGGKDSNPLHDIMPFVVFNRRENVSLMPYRPLLSGKTDGPFPQRGVLHTFTINPRALPSEATPILNGPDGDCVVVRRLVGAGAVTLVGFDFNDTRFSQFENVEADIFWHRVLGRSGNLRPLYDQDKQIDTSQRPRWMVDVDIPRLINISGVSAVGALVGFLVFAIYWLVVGPPLFLLLKRKDLHRHSWLAFVAGGVVFTVLAWGLATFLRPLRTTATHFTVLDHVYGQPVQRARAWASVLVPRYGTATVSVGSATGIDDRSASAIAAFESPNDDLATTASFPDSRGYPIDARSPDAIRVPVRATVKQVQVEWSGSPTWEMIRPVQPAGAPPLAEGEQPVIRAFPPGANIPPGAPLVMGTIRHNLPGPIVDGVAILVRGQTNVSGNLTQLSQGVEAIGRAVVLPTFDPGVDLDLSALFPATGPGELRQWLSGRTASSGNSAIGVVSNTVEAGSRVDRLYASAFLHASQQPDFSNRIANIAVSSRQLLHGFDLSRWMTQPCVIIIGFVGKEGGDGVESPVPLYVDGEAVPSNGLTFVRWVYPLSPTPPPVGPPDAQVGRTPRPVPKPADAAGEGT